MSDGVKIERLTRQMLCEIAEIERICFSSPWSEKSLELLLGDGAVGFAATLDGKGVVAYAGMLTVLDEGQITNVATLPEYRGRGFARAIMLSLEEYARENNISLLSLEVRWSNDAARALYCSLDWCEVGVRKNFYKQPTEDAIIMIKKL